MSKIEQLEKRLSELEQLVSSMCELNTAELVNEKLDDAKVMAIYSIALDLAIHAGVSSEDFLKHYEIRFRWWHDYYLRQVEEQTPSLAAEIDLRSVSECGVEPTYPSIFEPPQP